ncbi:MAG: T9SS type A sorting domain-containing protein [Bergeyella sp.]|nr:T9SS type A sorting domain-containing protein [Bergeyella sp.]
MKKRGVLTFLSLSVWWVCWAQDAKDITLYFRNQREQMIEKYNQLYLSGSLVPPSKTQSKITDKLSSFAGDIPVFIANQDAGANQASEVSSLEDGTLEGLDNNKIDGDEIRILLMDAGNVFDGHQEFKNKGSRIFYWDNTANRISSHSTSVAGMIGAKGINLDAKGVLENVTLDTYTYRTSNNKDSFSKLATAPNVNISNHSYGTDLGWIRIHHPYSIYNKPGWYWVGNYRLSNKDTYSGTYYSEDANFDRIVYENPRHIIIKAAGNTYGQGPGANEPKFKYDYSSRSFIPFGETDIIPANNCSKGYNCIGRGSLAKNIIVVGAIEPLSTLRNIYTSPTITKWKYSSAGPRKDGAIKPDLVAVGAKVVTPSYVSKNRDDTYTKDMGTSFSAPVVTGIAGGLTQLNRILTGDKNFTFTADKMKALLIHTANEAGNIGPDVWYGYGLVNAKKAANVLIDKKNGLAYFEKVSLKNGSTFVKEFIGKRGQPLKASISWIDPAAEPFTKEEDQIYNTASRLVNDLDLRIVDTKTFEILYPWKLDIKNPTAPSIKGDNTVDNAEQVIVESPVADRVYRVEVSHKRNLVDTNGKNIPHQSFSIIVTGYSSKVKSSDNSEETPPRRLQIYPTKTRDYVNITGVKKNSLLSVFDFFGNALLSIPIDKDYQLDFSSYSSGVYLLQITDDSQNSKEIKKIIKE